MRATSSDEKQRPENVMTVGLFMPEVGLGAVRYEVHHHRGWRQEQFGDPIEGVFALLTARGEDADQNLLGFCAVFGAVATPGFPRHDGWSQSPLRRIVGGLNAGTVKKGE